LKKFLKEICGAGILFFYYMKFIILIGLPILYFGLGYKHNIILDILWGYCLFLLIKDLFGLIVSKKA